MKCPRLIALVAALVVAGAASAKNPVVLMETSYGTIKIELFEDKAPVTVKNFLAYVDEKHYDGTIFHRVIPTFMIQGGGVTPGMNLKKAHESIKSEANNGLKNQRGTLAMAQSTGPDSATDQFFINVVDNPHLDQQRFTVFARVIEGMDVVDKIRQVSTTTVKKIHRDVPVEDIVIKSVRREKQ
jgi:cyclophilin family peptidyl-prolyl cis-trans isomerase